MKNELLEQTDVLLYDLEKFINKIDDLNRYNEPITQEKWEHLLFYYFEPLKKQYELAENEFYEG